MAVIIDGRKVSEAVRNELAAEIKRDGINAGLAVIIVGDDPASKTYVRNKRKACENVGIRSYEYSLDANTPQRDLIGLIEKLNDDPAVDGILCQLPLPSHIDERAVIGTISKDKDVDAFGYEQVGRISANDCRFLPCTPAGIIELLDHYKIDPSGRHCVIVGRSNIVGKPLAMLMLNRDATVTVCHSKTVGLCDFTRRADILVSAVGKPGIIMRDMVSEGAVVIDVGINRTSDGTLKGDVDFEPVSEIASYITPVPGGVGPMTITELLKNTVTAYKLNHKCED